MSLLLFRVLGSSLHLPSQWTLAPRQDPLLPSPCGETLLMVDHIKMLLVRLSVGGLSHMQVYHCPHPKLVHLLLFRVHGSIPSICTEGSGTQADRLLPSPCWEALLMVDHLNLKMVALSNLKAFLPSIPLGPSTLPMIQVLLVKVHRVLPLLRS